MQEVEPEVSHKARCVCSNKHKQHNTHRHNASPLPQGLNRFFQTKAQQEGAARRAEVEERVQAAGTLRSVLPSWSLQRTALLVAVQVGVAACSWNDGRCTAPRAGPAAERAARPPCQPTRAEGQRAIGCAGGLGELVGVGRGR